MHFLLAIVTLSHFISNVSLAGRADTDSVIRERRAKFAAASPYIDSSWYGKQWTCNDRVAVGGSDYNTDLLLDVLKIQPEGRIIAKFTLPISGEAFSTRSLMDFENKGIFYSLNETIKTTPNCGQTQEVTVQNYRVTSDGYLIIEESREQNSGKCNLKWEADAPLGSIKVKLHTTSGAFAVSYTFCHLTNR